MAPTVTIKRQVCSGYNSEDDSIVRSNAVDNDEASELELLFTDAVNNYDSNNNLNDNYNDTSNNRNLSIDYIYDNKEESQYNKEESIYYDHDNKEESIDDDYDSAQPSECGDDCNNIVKWKIDDKPLVDCSIHDNDIVYSHSL